MMQQQDELDPDMALLEGEEENQVPPSTVETAFHGHGNDADAIKSTLFHARWVKAYPSAPSTLVVGPNFDSTNSGQRDARGFTEIHDFDTPMADVSLDTHIGSSICVARIMEEPLNKPQPLTAKQRQLIGSFIRSEVPRAVQPSLDSVGEGFAGLDRRYWAPSLSGSGNYVGVYHYMVAPNKFVRHVVVKSSVPAAAADLHDIIRGENLSFGQVVSHPAYQATLDLASRQSRRLAYQVASAIGATISHTDDIQANTKSIDSRSKDPKCFIGANCFTGQPKLASGDEVFVQPVCYLDHRKVGGRDRVLSYNEMMSVHGVDPQNPTMITAVNPADGMLLWNIAPNAVARATDVQVLPTCMGKTEDTLAAALRGSGAAVDYVDSEPEGVHRLQEQRYRSLDGQFITQVVQSTNGFVDAHPRHLVPDYVHVGGEGV